MADKSIEQEVGDSVNRAAVLAAVENEIELAAIPDTTATQAAKLDDPYLVTFAEPFDADNPK